MKVMELLTILAVGSADASQNGMGTIIAVSLVTALITSLIVVSIFHSSMKNREVSVNDTQENAVTIESPKVKPVQAAITPPPIVLNGISDEVVAVIAAAVASMAPEGKKFAVRSVSRVRVQRSAWAAAGLAESTRPF